MRLLHSVFLPEKLRTKLRIALGSQYQTFLNLLILIPLVDFVLRQISDTQVNFVIDCYQKLASKEYTEDTDSYGMKRDSSVLG